VSGDVAPEARQVDQVGVRHQVGEDHRLDEVLGAAHPVEARAQRRRDTHVLHHEDVGLGQRVVPHRDPWHRAKVVAVGAQRYVETSAAVTGEAVAQPDPQHVRGAPAADGSGGRRPYGGAQDALRGLTQVHPGGDVEAMAGLLPSRPAKLGVAKAVGEQSAARAGTRRAVEDARSRLRSHHRSRVPRDDRTRLGSSTAARS
jgi:hypothetical protein